MSSSSHGLRRINVRRFADSLRWLGVAAVGSISLLRGKKILASLCGKRPLWPPEASKEASLWPLERHVWPPQRPVWPPERPTWLPQREKSLFGLPRGPKRPLSVERGLFDFPRGPKRGSLASREASFFGFPRKTLERAPRAPKGHKRAPKRL